MSTDKGSASSPGTGGPGIHPQGGGTQVCSTKGTHPLELSVRRVGRQAHRLLLCYAVSCSLAVLLVAVFLLGSADYLFRFRDFGVRLICTAMFAVVSLVVYWRFLRPALRLRYTPLQVARRIEARFPELRDGLSSSLAFLRDPHRLGSEDLTQSVIRNVTSRVSKLELADCLDARLPRRTAVLTLFVLGIVLSACYADLDSALLAGRRLVMPWRQDEWPRWNELSFSAPPQRLAVGDDFEVELLDLRGHLPEQVTIQYQFAGEAERIDSRPMTRLGDRMVDQYFNVTRSFKYRAVGGDDDTMPWHAVEVVEAPELVELNVSLTPPAYTGLPERRAGRPVRAIAGSLVEITGTANKPLDLLTCTLSINGTPVEASPMLADDGQEFSLPSWVAQEPASIEFSWVDRDGIQREKALRCEIEVLPDQPPVIAIASPLPGSLATANATIPLQVQVTDDFGVDTVQLRHRAATLVLEPDAGVESRSTKPTYTIEWPLGPLGLSPGDVFEYQIVASDFKPQTTSSGTRRLMIESAEEVLRRLTDQTTQVRRELSEVLESQRSVHSQVMRAKLKLDELQRFDFGDLDALRAAELNQRHIARQLRNGVTTRIAELLEQMHSNQVGRADDMAALRQLKAEVARLQDVVLSSAESRLAETLKLARRLSDDERLGPRVAAGLSEVAALQEVAVQRLEAALNRQVEQESFGALSQELRRILAELERIRSETESLPTVARSVRDLSSGQRTALQNLVRRQRSLAARYDRWEDALAEYADDPEAGIQQSARPTLDFARQGAVGGALREAGRNLVRNHLGEAIQSQLRAEQTLREMEASFAGDQTESAGTGTADHRRSLAKLVAEILRRQQFLLRQTVVFNDAAQPSSDEVRNLAGEQQTLREVTQQLANDSSDLPTSAFTLRGAAMDMAAAARALEANDVSEEAQRPQRSAVEWLQILVENTLTEPPTPDGPTESNSGVSESESTGGATVAQLKLLRALQVSLHERTASVTAAIDSGEDRRQELNRLADEQLRLAEIVSQLGQPTNSRVERREP